MSWPERPGHTAAMDDARFVDPSQPPHPVYLVWELTLRCDQACLHCGSRAGLPRAGELDTDEVVSVARQLAPLGMREVTLIGGEAYLRADWSRIARAITDSGVRCSLVTGGRGFGRAQADAARDAGISTVSVSVDGTRGVHDAVRAVPGSWDAAMHAIDAAVEAGLVVTANTQVNRRNVGELEVIVEHLVAKGIAAWQIQLTTPMGRAAAGADLLLQPYDLLEVIPTLGRLAESLRARGRSLWAADNVGYYGPWETALRSGTYWQGCTAGGWTLGIQSDGLVKGCASLPGDTYGDMNVRDRPLAEIVANSAALARTRDRTKRWGRCAPCYHGDICRGGCTWTAEPFGHGVWEVVVEPSGA